LTQGQPHGRPARGSLSIEHMSVENRFFHLAGRVTTLAGSPWAFVLAVILVVVWTLTGPLFGFSDSWQLIANTTTTLITFLMVFVIQHAQNRETRAMQLKLDELVGANEAASNELIDAEDLDEQHFKDLDRRFHDLAERARQLDPSARISIHDALTEAEKAIAGHEAGQGQQGRRGAQGAS